MAWKSHPNSTGFLPEVAFGVRVFYQGKRKEARTSKHNYIKLRKGTHSLAYRIEAGGLAES